MSIHHIERAAELTLPATKKLALMAICDDASKDTRVAYPGMDKVMLWSGVTFSSAQAIVRQLRADGLILRLGGGHSGRRTEYLVFPTPEEIASIGTFLKAVDNPEKKGARLSALQVLKGAEKLRLDAGASVPPVKPPVDDQEKQSSESPHHGGPVDNRDDDRSSFEGPTGWVARRRYRKLSSALDMPALIEKVRPIFAGDHGIDAAVVDRVITAIAYQVLGKAANSGTKVMYPTAYVASAINLEPEVWRRVAFNLEAVAS